MWGNIARRLWSEVLLASRFGSVGALATSVHLLLVWGLLRCMPTAPQTSNFLAFLGAFGVSFIGNYYFTFRAPGHWRVALPKFLATSLLAYGINAFMFTILLHSLQRSPLTSALISAICVPAFSFIVSRFWVFRSPPPLVPHSPPTTATVKDD